MNKIFNQLTGIAQTKTKLRRWFYQFEGKPKVEIHKRGDNWWYSTSPDGVRDQGSNTLAGAKGDLRYAGAKVWSELI